jgi:hypothetical protein
MSRSRRLRILGLLAVLLAGTAALAWSFVPFQIERVDAQGIEIHGLALPGLGADRLALEFKGFSLARLEARGVRVRGRLDENGLSLGWLDAALKGGKEGGATPAFRLEDVEIGLETPEGPQSIRLSGDEARLAAAFNGPLSGQAALSLRSALHVESPRLDLVYQGHAISITAFRLDMPANRAAARLSFGDWQAGLALSWTMQANAAAIRLDIEEPHLETLTLSGTLAKNSFTGTLSDAQKRLAVRLSARHDPASGKGSLSFNADRLAFAPDGLQPGQFLPHLKDKLTGFKGGLDLDGKLSWSPEGVKGQADLVIDELSGTAMGIRFHRLNGAVAFDRLTPLGTPPGQMIALAAAQAGVPLTNGRLSFSFGEEGRLALESGSLDMAGGLVTLKPARFDEEGAALLVLEAKGLDLGKLAQLSGVEGLAVEGLAEGSLPLVVDKDGVAITGGKLTVAQPGWVRWRPLVRPSALQGGGEAVSLMMAALADFHYQALSLDVDGRAGGETSVGFHIKGRNPSLHEGYPLEFNLAVSGPLDQVVESALEGWHAPPDIAQRMEETRARRH